MRPGPAFAALIATVAAPVVAVPHARWVPAVGALSAQASTSASTGASTSARDDAQDPLPVREIVLANGMRVLLLPRPGAPTMSFVMQLGVGGVHETPGVTGIAHLLEHMLFKGSETIGTSDVEAERALFRQMDAKHDEALEAEAAGDTVRARALREEIDALEDEARSFVVPNEYDRILTRAGAQGLNATTTNEATTYFVELPANRAELFFAVESDRMANPVFREFYSERDVVMEERRMRVDTSPAGAYVTYEHEYILVFRKGDKRPFRSAAQRLARQQSAFF